MNLEEISKNFLAASTEFAQETVTLRIDVQTAICIVSTLQLACRHPHFEGPTRTIAEDFARNLQHHLGSQFSEDIWRGLELGWDEAHDVSTLHPDWKCRVCGCTEEKACAGGCSWVEPNLCSRCAPAAKSIIIAR